MQDKPGKRKDEMSILAGTVISAGKAINTNHPISSYIILCQYI